MKIAVVAGGWHYPLDFFQKLSAQADGADLFVVSHRSPELPIVREEKREILEKATGPLADLDRELYREFPTIDGLRRLGWKYDEAPNIVGDWGFLNQWLETHDFRDYNAVLSCHDDTFILGALPLMSWSAMPWLIISNGRYPQAPEGYVRGSFELFNREMLHILGGKIDLGAIGLTREGKTDTPAGLNALSSWNDTGVPLRRFMVRHGLTKHIYYLSQYYRISPWVIEAERGFLHYQDGAPWSFEEGVKEYLPVGCMADSHRQGVSQL